MNAEGDDTKPEAFTIHECEPPRRVSLTSQVVGEQNAWHFVLELTEVAGTTTLTFSQSVPDAEMATGVGPGWEYYLDRLVAAETGADVAGARLRRLLPGAVGLLPSTVRLSPPRTTKAASRWGAAFVCGWS